jgi:putative hydrolase
MTLTVPLDQDYHVHSTFSDGASTVADNVAVARDRGLRRLCLTDHVRSNTTWLPDFVAAVAALRADDGAELVTGAEAKILDSSGRLDLPGDLTGIDLVLIADHQFPAVQGPVLPGELRVQIERGRIAGQDVIETLVDATAAALITVCGRQVLLAHLFSILPKLGLDEAAVPDASLGRLAGRAAEAGAMLEINEKWNCPSARTVAAFGSAGVQVVAGSDSHDCASVGVFRSVRQTIDAVAAAGSR